MRRLIWGFAGRTYHIVGKVISRLIYPGSKTWNANNYGHWKHYDQKKNHAHVNGAVKGWLHVCISGRRYIGWCPDPHDESPSYVEIHLQSPKAVHALQFQSTYSGCPDPRHRYDTEAFLATFDLQFVIAGNVERNWVTYDEVSSQGGYSHFFFIHRLGPSIYPSPKKYQDFKHPKKYLKF